MNNKLLVIGIDGGTWELLNALIEKGYLPFLHELISHGNSCDLMSTTPPVTPAAFSSFLTGLSPQDHGILTFRGFDRGKHLFYKNDACSLPVSHIFRLLNDGGVKTGSVGIPMTYPPSEVNGFMVSGFDIPLSNLDYVYPPEEKEDYINNHYPEFHPAMVDSHIDEENYERFLGRMCSLIQEKTSISIHLAKKYEVDLLVVHYQQTDALQHAMYTKLLQAATQGPNDDMEEKALQVYRVLDNEIKRLIESLDFDTFMLFSDHGFQSLLGTLYPNRLLLQKGSLAINPDLSKNTFRSGITQLYKKLPPWVKRLYRKYKKEEVAYSDHRIEKHATTNMFVDWSDSKAVVIGGDLNGHLYVFDERIIKESIEKDFGGLCEVREFKQGSHGPDFTLIPPGGWNVSETMGKKIKEAHHGFRGTHRQEGIFILSGKNIIRTELTRAELIDIPPTLLGYFGIPVPMDMKGSILKDQFLSFPDITRCPQRGKKQQPYGEKEIEEELVSRMQALGYM
jgi:predicted AlkP superfamily phosphohydrolase/phosphomutase